MFLNTIFQKMIDEQKSIYAHKGDLIRNYINLIIHEALKLQPSEHSHQHNNAASRLTSVFFELMERQFPVESSGNPLRFKTAQDYAKHLNVHVNYLNRAVKEVTGKPTTAHITERIVNEAKALLLAGTVSNRYLYRACRCCRLQDRTGDRQYAGIRTN